MVVHGYGQLARYFLNAFEPMAANRFIAAPEGLSRFYTDAAHQRVGASWMTREDRQSEIQDHIAYLDQLAGILCAMMPHASLHVLGFSQGVATVARWLANGSMRISQLVCWGGSLPPDIGSEALSGAVGNIRVDLVHGTEDELVPMTSFRSNQERLAATGAHLKTHLFQGGHRLDPLVLARCMEGK